MNKLDKVYTLPIHELVDRPIIRDTFNEEWMNKMTDEEHTQREEDAMEIVLAKGVLNKFPDINAALLSEHIDTTVLYKLFKTAKDEYTR